MRERQAERIWQQEERVESELQHAALELLNRLDRSARSIDVRPVNRSGN
jgi:hypothetical protein